MHGYGRFILNCFTIQNRQISGQRELVSADHWFLNVFHSYTGFKSYQQYQSNHGFRRVRLRSVIKLENRSFDIFNAHLVLVLTSMNDFYKYNQRHLLTQNTLETRSGSRWLEFPLSSDVQRARGLLRNNRWFHFRQERLNIMKWPILPKRYLWIRCVTQEAGAICRTPCWSDN